MKLHLQNFAISLSNLYSLGTSVEECSLLSLFFHPLGHCRLWCQLSDHSLGTIPFPCPPQSFPYSIQRKFFLYPKRTAEGHRLYLASNIQRSLHSTRALKEPVKHGLHSYNLIVHNQLPGRHITWSYV